MDIITILPSVIPALMDILKKATDRIISGRKVSVDEEIKLIQAETERLKTLAELDRPAGEISRWVADFRASFRYVFCLLILLFTSLFVITGVDKDITNAFIDLTSGVIFFLIGHRTYLYFVRK